MVMFAEVRKDGQWHKVGKEFVSTYEEMEGQLTDRVFDGHNKELEEFLLARSHLFGTNESNVSEDIKKHKQFKNSAGFLVNLEELLKFNWDEEKYKIGYISEWQYERLKKDGLQPVNVFKEQRTDIPSVSPFLMDMINLNPSLRKARKYLIDYKYDRHTIKEKFHFFCYVSIPKLIELIPEGGTVYDVRIIFSVSKK